MGLVLIAILARFLILQYTRLINLGGIIGEGDDLYSASLFKLIFISTILLLGSN